MEESPIVKQWQQKALERGLERGLSALRSSLLGVLAVRFSEPVPEDVRSAIAGQKDVGSLSRWLVLASTAQTLDGFRAAVLPGNGQVTG
jgi:hypothetical protein